MIKQFVFIFLLSLTSLAFASNNIISEAPAIKLPGQTAEVVLSDFKGKVVYLDFWASWCLPCKKSFPWMQDIQHSYADQGFEIIAINLDKDREKAEQFLKDMQVDFTVAFDESGESASAYKLKGMPSTYLIGRDGKVYASHVGFRDTDKQQLEQAIQGLLNK